MVSVRWYCLFLFSTSNHNARLICWPFERLSFISFLHQTTTLSKFTITSVIFSFISFLHQTTTINCFTHIPSLLSFISFLHQTTTSCVLEGCGEDCLLSLFYIKPQHGRGMSPVSRIVFYLFSTSNHNCFTLPVLKSIIVFYLFSTSNHNLQSYLQILNKLSFISFLHQTTTEDVVIIGEVRLSFISFLHQTTTFCGYDGHVTYCLLSLFYIKPQPPDGLEVLVVDCLLSLFYIKPQLTTSRNNGQWYCLLSLFYIKPQLSLYNTSPYSIVFYLFSTSNHNN